MNYQWIITRGYLITIGCCLSLIGLNWRSAQAEASPPIQEHITSDPQSPSEQPISEQQVAGIRDLQHRPAKNLNDWLTQVEAVTVPVIGVNLDRTETGLAIILDTQDRKPLLVDPQTFRTEGNRLIAEIPNAVLALPEGGAFVAENPTADIASVQVVQLDANKIRITVTGKDVPPKTAVTLKVGEFSAALTSDPDEPETEAELVVTGAEQGRYQVPNASSATRTDTPIRDTPAAIQVIPQEVIRDQQVVGIEEAVENISAVSFKGTNDSRGYNFAIRGFENAPILRDGFRVYGGFQGIAETANLDRVEVLKGPAAILYGDVQPGGIINLVSKPALSQPQRQVELQVGGRNFVRPRIDFTGPITQDERVLYRLNMLYQKNNSWRDYDTQQRRWSFAPTVTAKLTDRTDLTVFLEYLDEESFADFGQIIVGDRLARVPRRRVPNNPDDSISNQYLRVGYNLEHRFNDNWRIRNTFSFQDSRFDYSVFALPFRILNPRTNILGRSFADQDGINKVYSLQTNATGKFTTGPIQHTLLAGIDLAKSENRLITKNTFPSRPLLPFNIFAPDYSVPVPDESRLPLSNDNLLNSRRLGIYLQDQLSMLDNKLIVLAGVRYDIVDRDSTIQTATRTTEVDTQDRAVTPRVGLLYRIIPDLAIYGSYSRSFNPAAGEFGLPISVGGSVLPPETGEGFEAGIKADFLKRKLAVTLAYFDVKKQNVTLADPDNIGFSIAAGEQRSRGVELDVVGELLPGWNIIAAYAYIPDAEVTKDVNPANVGSRLSNIAEHSASLWTTYEIQRGTFKGLGFGLGFNFVGERFGGLPNSYRADSYFLTNAGLFYRKRQWRFAVNVKNLFNVDYVQSLSQTSRTRNNYPGEPLTVVGSISAEF
jgi:iron complex outermembrane receptor protein